MSNAKNFVRGGQIVLHNIRMFNQIILRVLVTALLLFVAINLAWFFHKTSYYERYIAFQWCFAHLNIKLNSRAIQNIVGPVDGKIYRIYSQAILNATSVQNIIFRIKKVFYQGLYLSGSGFGIMFLGLIYWLRRRGLSQTQNQRIKGDYLAKPNEIKKIIQKNKLISDLSISESKISIPKFSERQHFLFHGTTGSGKSTAIKEFLDYIKKVGDRAFVYDKGCVLTQEYYDPDTDQLMNPLDDRTPNWSLWKECRDKADFEAFACAQIPMPLSTQDPFWINAARTIFAAAANRMRKEMKEPKMLPLLKYLLTAELSDMQFLLRGTEAESLMSEKIEKTAISIKSVLATYLKSLCYIKEGDHPFSIREWIESSKSKQWLFISSLGDKHETLKPLFTAWIDIAINTLISLPENKERRIWIVLDELTSLHKIPKITDGLSESRKFGGCFIIGIQNIAKAREIYGSDGAKDISSLLNTRFMFRQPDPDIADWSARNLGETVLEEVNESISYGANTIRDGISISRSERRKPVVTYSEIMALDNLECYLRLGGKYPISRVEFSYDLRSKKNPPFVPRIITQDDLRVELEEMIEQFRTTPAQDTNSNHKKNHSMEENENSSDKSLTAFQMSV